MTPLLLILAPLFSQSPLSGTPSPTLSWVDLDGDSDRDLVLLGPGGSVRILRRGPADVFEAVGLPMLEPALGVRVSDHDGDGAADLMVFGDFGIRLFQQVSGLFEEVSRDGSLGGLPPVSSASWVDADGVGGPDLHVVTAGRSGGHRVFLNEGGGRFRELDLGPDEVQPGDVGVGPVVAVDTPRPPGADSVEAGRGGDRGRPAGRTDDASSRLGASAPTTLPPGSGSATAGPPALNIFDCVNGLADQAGGSCIQASSDPTQGVLLPYPGQGNSFVGPAVIAGGDGNTALGFSSFVGGGTQNLALTERAAIAGGVGNRAGYRSFVGGGDNNTATGNLSTVAGGKLNDALQSGGVVGGGEDNVSDAVHATIAGGRYNAATGAYSFVGGGGGDTQPEGNAASGSHAVATGGYQNRAAGVTSVVAGGSQNEANATESVVGGGKFNVADGINSVVAGGEQNRTGDGTPSSGFHATVSGGFGNEALGAFAAIPGGSDNAAEGQNSLAAGEGARANHDGTFVWSDSDPGNFGSTGPDQFLVQAAGGVGIGTNSPEDTLDVQGRIRSSGVDTGLVCLNPNNASASAKLDWKDDVARIRVGGSGAGSTGGLDVQTTGDDSLMRIQHDGRVGIGTTTPSAALHVEAENTVLLANSVDTAGGVALQGSANGNGGIGLFASAPTSGYSGFFLGPVSMQGGDVELFNSGSGTLFVENDLEVRGDEVRHRGAGFTLESDGALAVDAETDLTLESGSSLTLDGGAALDLTTGGILDLTAGLVQATAPTILMTGSLGISGGPHAVAGPTTFTDPITGTISFALSAACCSDRRWKRDVEPLEGVLDRLLELEGKSYYWKDSSPLSEDTKLQYGFIAQDVLEVFPNLVKEYTDGEHFLLVYSQVVPLLVEGLRELRSEKDAEIEGLRAANQALEARVARLESMQEELLANLEAGLARLAETR